MPSIDDGYGNAQTTRDRQNQQSMGNGGNNGIDAQERARMNEAVAAAAAQNEAARVALGKKQEADRQQAFMQSESDYNQAAQLVADQTNFKSQVPIFRSKAPLAPPVSSLSNADAKPEDNSITGAITNGVNNFSSGLRNFLTPLSKMGQEAFKGSMYQTALDNTLGVFGGHPGQTYGESQVDYYPFPGAKNDAYEANARNQNVFDQFTYEMTPEERNKQLPHAFIDGNPTTQIQKDIAAQTNGRAPSYTIYNSDGSPNIAATVNATNSEQRASGNGVSAPLSGNTYGNGFNGFAGSGGFTRIGGGTPGNYFSAIPDGVFNSGGSPRLMGVQTSYGNSYNAADQWTAGGNATQAVRAAATTGES